MHGRHQYHWESLAQGDWPWLVTDAFPLYLTQNAVSTGEEKPGGRRTEPDPVSGHEPLLLLPLLPSSWGHTDKPLLPGDKSQCRRGVSHLDSFQVLGFLPV